MFYDPDDALAAALLHYLDYWQQERESAYAAPESDEEERLRKALEHVGLRALDLLYQPGNLATILERDVVASPWEDLEAKVIELFAYDLVQEQVEASAAGEVLGRLKGLDTRVFHAMLVYVFLLRSRPSITATKYLQQVIRLYLAGFRGEVLVMCGAVLESALRDRLPDSLLRELKMTPKHQKTGVFSVGQRMRAEASHIVFSPEERKRFWDVVNWRNDAVHVQYDIGPDPEVAMMETAYLLGRINPKDRS